MNIMVKSMCSIQQFKGIPMQIKMNDGNSEKRFALPDYFIKAIAAAQKQR